MKVGTKIAQSVLKCRQKYTEYSKAVHNMAVIPVKPRVSYEPGVGWMIDGELFKMTAEHVIEQFQICYNYWAEQILIERNK